MTEEEKKAWVENHKARIAASGGTSEGERQKRREELREKQEGSADLRAVAVNEKGIHNARNQISSAARRGEKIVSDDQYKTISANAARVDAHARGANLRNLAAFEATQADAIHEGARGLENTRLTSVANIAEAEAVERARRATLAAEDALLSGDRAFLESGAEDLVGYDAHSPLRPNPTTVSDVRNQNLSAAKIWEQKRDDFRQRLKAAKTDEERARIKDEGNAWLAKNPRPAQSVRQVIDAAYAADYNAINDRVRRGEISPFMAKALHDELQAKREAKIKREAGVDLAYQRQREAAEKAKAEADSLKDRMGQTTYDLYVAMDRLRDPTLDKDERAISKDVAGTAAQAMGDIFLENKFGPNSGYKSQVTVFEDDDPKTGMKQIAYSVTFADANGKPVSDPKTGRPVEIKFDADRVKTALKEHYGFEDVEVGGYDEEGNETPTSTRFQQSGEGDNTTDTVIGGAGIEVDEGYYGGRRSRSTIARANEEAEAKSKREAADTAAWVKERAGEVLTMPAGKDRDSAVNELIKKDPDAGTNVKKFLAAQEENERKREHEENLKKGYAAASDAFDKWQSALKPIVGSDGVGRVDQASAKKAEAAYREALKKLREDDPELGDRLGKALEAQAKGLTEDQRKAMRDEGSALAASLTASLINGDPLDGISITGPGGRELNIYDAIKEIEKTNPLVLPDVAKLAKARRELDEAKSANEMLNRLADDYAKAATPEDRMKIYADMRKIDERRAATIVDNFETIRRSQGTKPVLTGTGEKGFLAPNEEGEGRSVGELVGG